ncbi:MAG: hypothetical protein M1824_001465 [Vezdaea acicularis]|nr:MAG: hypothetical protein M1824_001465 [Vezdaea acicularis]
MRCGRTAYAEAPDSSPKYLKKPIYDDVGMLPSAASKAALKAAADSAVKADPKPTSKAAHPSSSQSVSNPTPTDRLEKHVRAARLSLQRAVSTGEDKLNNLLTQGFHLENSFTSTIASLAPSKGSSEKVLPGSIYVLVSAMAGSILTRNRNILLRFSVPLAAGITVGWIVLPITSRNVGDLVWTYEEKVPAVRNAHLYTRGFLQEAWRFGKVHAELGKKKIEQGVEGARGGVEGWVSGKK